MKAGMKSGVTLVELLVVMAVSTLVGALVLPFLLRFQDQCLAETGRNDLHDRAERLLRFIASDIREAAFLTGPRPRRADGTPVSLVHDSLPGDPVEALPFALQPENGGSSTDDALTLVKGVSFVPPLRLWLPAPAGAAELTLNRRPNQPPASSRELQPLPEAIDHFLLAGHPDCYRVLTAGQTSFFEPPLPRDVPAGTELLGVRAYRYQLQPHAGSNRLRRDDFTSREILDDAVDGLQFEYLLADGQLVDTPDPAAIRAVRISLLVRALQPERGYLDAAAHRLADRTYGPFNDPYRRLLVSELVEVKNHGR